MAKGGLYIDPLNMSTHLLSTFYYKGLNMAKYIQQPVLLRKPIANSNARDLLRMKRYYTRLALRHNNYYRK